MSLANAASRPAVPVAVRVVEILVVPARGRLGRAMSVVVLYSQYPSSTVCPLDYTHGDSQEFLAGLKALFHKRWRYCSAEMDASITRIVGKVRQKE